MASCTFSFQERELSPSKWYILFLQRDKWEQLLLYCHSCPQLLLQEMQREDVKSSSNIIAFQQKPSDLQIDRSQIVVAILAFSQDSHFKVTDHLVTTSHNQFATTYHLHSYKSWFLIERGSLRTQQSPTNIRPMQMPATSWKYAGQALYFQKKPPGP